MAVFPSLPFFLETSSLTTFYWMSVVSAGCFVGMHVQKRIRNKTSKLKFRCLLFPAFCVVFSDQLFVLWLLSFAFRAAASCTFRALGTL